MNFKDDKSWAKQDFAMAKLLKDYGFTCVYRVGEQKLLAAFDNGPAAYELPWLCFMGMKVGDIIGIDELIIYCKERCR